MCLTHVCLQAGSSCVSAARVRRQAAARAHSSLQAARRQGVGDEREHSQQRHRALLTTARREVSAEESWAVNSKFHLVILYLRTHFSVCSRSSHFSVDCVQLQLLISSAQFHNRHYSVSKRKKIVLNRRYCIAVSRHFYHKSFLLFDTSDCLSQADYI